MPFILARTIAPAARPEEAKPHGGAIANAGLTEPPVDCIATFKTSPSSIASLQDLPRGAAPCVHASTKRQALSG